MPPYSISRRRLLEAIGASATLPNLSTATDGEKPSYHAYSPGGEHPNRLVLEGNDLVTKYRFAVSGDLIEGETTDLSDLSYGSDVLGFIGKGGVDDYWFSGDISRFDSGDGLDVYVNGRQVDRPVGDRFTEENGGGQRRPDCLSLEPLSYQDQSVVDFYGYEPDAGEENSQQSDTPTDLDEPGVSRLFLYEGPEGLSLVLIHGGDESEDGGAVSFRIEGIPDGVEWVVEDDGYEEANDEFSVQDGTATADWAWGVGKRNDGGALGYFPEEFRLRIEPRFDDDAELEPFEPGTVDRWEVLSGDATDPTVREVPMDRPLVVATGGC